MPRRVLDTNILINHWGDQRRGRPHANITNEHARRWARQLIELQNTDAILTPIWIEYVAGQRSARAVALARTSLGELEIIDGGDTSEQDWIEARRIAQRVPSDGSRRQMADRLIRAICNRLGYEPLSADNRFPD